MRIGFRLTGENANEENLITGIRYLNIQGMLPFENMVAAYVKETDNHVLYRVTPIFEGKNLLASAVVTKSKTENTEFSTSAKTNSYIANKNTGKLHYSWCSSVDQMKETNKKYLNCTREQALSQGYDPCKRCNP